MAEDRQVRSYEAEDAQLRFQPPSNWQDFFHDDYCGEQIKNTEKRGSFWKKPPTKIYSDNFGFGVNRYQCMIDYLDKKDRGVDVDPSELRLPFLEDRCLNKYSARKPVKFYDNHQIDDLIDKGEEINSRIRQNDAATHGNVLNRTHSGWSMTKKYVQLVKKSNVGDYKTSQAEAESKDSGKLQAKALGSVGVSFALDSMDPLNLTLMTAHNNLDHALYMTSRQNRMNELDNQLGSVVDDLTDGANNVNSRAKKELGRKRNVNLTPYDQAENMRDLASVTEDLSLRNKMRRKMEYEDLEDGVDSLLKYDRSRNRIRNNLNALDDTVNGMEDSVTAMRKRHRIERGMEQEIPVAVLSSLTKKKARQMLDLHVDDEDVDDPEFARLKMRRRHKSADMWDDTTTSTFKKREERPDTISDVQIRVMARATQINGASLTSGNVSERAKYINIYVPRHNTAEDHGIVAPSRTELNIDYMARTLAEKGKMQRKFDVDEEENLPASGLNTFAYNQYSRSGAIKPVSVVPSNSLRVRSAVCVARQRNAIAGR